MRSLILSATISTGLLMAAGVFMFCGAFQPGEAAAREDRSPPVAETPAPRGAEQPSGRKAAQAVRSAGQSAPDVTPAVAEVLENPAPIGMVSVPAGRALAKVNDVEITLRDLIPIGDAASGATKSMSVEMYRSLLEQAIERELILEAAQAGGLELTEDQRRQRDRVRESILASRNGQGVRLDAVGSLEDQVDFEMRDAESQLLLTSLLAQEGVTPDVTEEQVRQHYQEHPGEYAMELGADTAANESAWRKIDLKIREKLAPAASAHYQVEVRGFLDGLRRDAEISVEAPNPH